MPNYNPLYQKSKYQGMGLTTSVSTSSASSSAMKVSLERAEMDTRASSWKRASCTRRGTERARLAAPADVTATHPPNAKHQVRIRASKQSRMEKRTLTVAILATYQAQSACACALCPSRHLHLEWEGGIGCFGFAFDSWDVCGSLHRNKLGASAICGDFTVVRSCTIYKLKKVYQLSTDIR